MSFRRKRQPRRPTHLEALTDKYVRGALTLDEYEACVGELIDLGIEDKPRVIPVSYDEVLKNLYRGPIREMGGEKLKIS